MSEQMGGANTWTLLRQLIQSFNGLIAVVRDAAPITSSQPANQFLAAPSASAGTPGFRTITSADLVGALSSAPVQTGRYTVATLPTGQAAGSRAYVTDATAPTFLGALTGGGTVGCPVIYNGTTWVAG